MLAKKPYSNKEIIKIMADALKTPEGTMFLKKTISEYIPDEYANVMNDVIDGKTPCAISSDIKENISNNILDNFNNGKRTEEEMKLLFSNKLTTEELKKLKEKETL